ncbi:HlyD family efflux transporter periplasmic adaptor subunit, partial [Oleiphilus sp. HI0061]
KMFNKIAAPFSGTIAKVLLEDDGTIIKKGQPLFKIVPDEEIVIETDEQIKDRQTKACTEFLANI